MKKCIITIIISVLIFIIGLINNFYCDGKYEGYTIKLNDVATRVGENFIVKVTADSGQHVTFTKIIIKLKYDTNYITFISGEYAISNNGQIVIEKDKLHTQHCNFELLFNALKVGSTNISVEHYEMYNNWGNTEWCDKVDTSTITINPNPNNKANEKESSYIVKQGDTLWGIAREKLGDGKLYTNLYNSNIKIIEDPRMIYPGQMILIP